MHNRCALIVEDSPTMRQLILFALRRIPGLSFIEASNGAEALEVLRKQNVDIILLDLNMPVMSGFTFLERLQEVKEKKLPPVVVITTEGALEDVERAQQLGAKSYVTKPVQAASLASTVSDVLERWPLNSSPH